MKPQKVIIDTDPGIDDAFAILYAALNPSIDLVGLTSVFGNVTAKTGAINALYLAELVGQEIPVAMGATAPLQIDPNPVSDYVHGPNGFGDLGPREPKGQPVALSAAEYLVQQINKAPGELVICPIGPLTNIALAQAIDPSICRKARLVIMGGGLELGNVTAVAEANVWNDPHAADQVFAAPWDMTLVGLDATSKIVCGLDDFAGLEAAAPVLGGFLNKASQFYARFYESHYGFKGCQMHDPAALVAVNHGHLFTCENTALTVVGEGALVGMTLRSQDPTRADVKVTMGSDDTAVKQEFLNTIKSGW